jgi:hypothetical protein
MVGPSVLGMGALQWGTVDRQFAVGRRFAALELTGVSVWKWYSVLVRRGSRG